MLAQHPQALQQQIAEVDGVEGLQPRLIHGVELAALAIGEGACLASGHAGGVKAPVLPVVDLMGERPCGPALVVHILRLQNLFQQADLIVGVQNGEGGLQAHEFSVATQDLGADGVEGAEPGHALAPRPHERADALLHLAGGLVGEGDRQQLLRPRPARRDDMGDAGGQHTRLARARTRQHQHRAIHGLHRLTLFRVEPFEIAWRPDGGGTGARSDAALPGGGRYGEIGLISARQVKGIGQGERLQARTE